MTSKLPWPDLWRYRFIVLLIGLVAVVLASPLADQEGMGRVIIQSSSSLVLLFGVYVSSAKRKVFVFVGALTVLWLSLEFWTDRFGSGGLNPEWARPALFAAICVAIFIVVEGAVLAAPVVDTNVICGGIACYFLMAIIWALFFAVIESFLPHSIRLPEPRATGISDLVYFSLTCLTTLGFGDIVPTSRFVRICSTIEAVTGVIYLSVFISRMVSLYRR